MWPRAAKSLATASNVLFIIGSLLDKMDNAGSGRNQLRFEIASNETRNTFLDFSREIEGSQIHQRKG